MGQPYRALTLVLFPASGFSLRVRPRGHGPVHCPADQKVYIDLSFYRELRDRFGAPGDSPRLT